MAITTEYSRLILKRATLPGVTPTIPLTSEIDNSWLPTDIMVGEVFVNTADDKMWIRTNGGIVPISLSGKSSENDYTTDAYLLPDTHTLAFDRTDANEAFTVDLSSLVGGIKNDYTIDAYLLPDNHTLAFDRTDASEAFTVDLSSLVSSGSTEDKNTRVGNFYGGGIIVSTTPVSGTSTELLIMSLENLVTGPTGWSNLPWTTVATPEGAETNNYDGMMNTDLIIAQSGHTMSAASICRAYSGGGFSDWYLPSLFEMANVLKAEYVLAKPFGSYSFPSGNFWTSTEGEPSKAFVVGTTFQASPRALFNKNRFDIAIRPFRKVIIYG